jgi:hypothetical protein
MKDDLLELLRKTIYNKFYWRLFIGTFVKTIIGPFCVRVQNVSIRDFV